MKVAATLKEKRSAEKRGAEKGEKKKLPLIALVGNPNTGKTTVLNALCRTRQRTANYPGTTVDKKIGLASLYEDREAEVLDLPGLYSLRSISPDEAIACDALEGRLPRHSRPDLILFVMDATCLRRNLYLFTQLRELGIPIVAALTMVDLLKRSGMKADIPLLEKRLGVPIVLTSGYREHYREHYIKRLKAVICRALEKKRAVAVDLLSGDALLPDSNLKSQDDLKPDSNLKSQDDLRPDNNPKSQDNLKSDPRFHNPAQEAVARYRWIEQLLAEVEERPPSALTRLVPRLDKLLTHRVIGLGCFMLIVSLVFQAIYTGAQPIMDLIEGLFGSLGLYAHSILEPLPLLSALVSDGIINGVGSVVVFLPQIMILFLLVGIMEDSGYLARAAFLTDRLFSWTGLNGRAFIPLLSSFACAIPGIMATRTMSDTKARLSTILVAPLISCSARLPVYLLLIGAFVEPRYGAFWAGIALLALHFLGVMVALPTAWLLNRGILKGRSTPFLMELPPYRWPHPFNVLHRSYEAGRKFAVQAGTIVFALSIVIWALSYFPRLDADSEALQSDRFQPEEQEQGKRGQAYRQLEYSYLGRLGHAIAPAFEPLGFDWRITVGILSAFPAREVIVSTLGIIYESEEGENGAQSSLRAKLRAEKHPDGSAIFSLPTVLSILIFFALCCQCVSTLAVIKRETGHWKWSLIVFAYMTTLAYVSSLLVYQGCLFLGLT